VADRAGLDLIALGRLGHHREDGVERKDHLGDGLTGFRDNLTPPELAGREDVGEPGQFVDVNSREQSILRQLAGG
jgi:hypothetical protein